MNHFMRETSREIGRLSGRINVHWGGPHHRSVVTSPLGYMHVYKYIYRNPVKARLCRSAIDWQFSSLRLHLGLKRGILPLDPDELLLSDAQNVFNWIDQDFEPGEDDWIRRALRKAEFDLAMDPGSRNPIRLEEWDSVPFDLRNYKK
jgi:hypothetical protein